MSACLAECPGPGLRRMQVPDVEAVLAIENAVYEFPWSRGNFIDSLAAGYEAWLLAEGTTVTGYFLALQGVDEMHLLNISVAPGQQGRGHARAMLDVLCRLCRQAGCLQLWLEVRQSNERARALYRRYGFTEVGQRRAYYPAANGLREDAVLMSLQLPAQEVGA
ncbi:ribosomal protein S18-alanine N-acetyltransferase [Pelomonas sp. APW6]|uniref:[Ribosomal protein bS18]-alanine N-acetyltransferase n=1 Tax=Roseateles subflavus TaxID=3053353 RepID=A0ABT7LEX3_9BURK|nr:ribosomal protein S18-alanine N-acetyltransferase [Pelomonas sp. APW6]MDL5031401.1 ribosomal protein S18-alanine N-acetyltransferase [Pelomonas sp. APW6]